MQWGGGEDVFSSGVVDDAAKRTGNGRAQVGLPGKPLEAEVGVVGDDLFRLRHDLYPPDGAKVAEI